jgi:hypothetical protein
MTSSFQLLLLFLVIIITYMVVVKGLPSDLIIGFASAWFVILWIGIDNMQGWSPWATCSERSPTQIPLEAMAIRDVENSDIAASAASATRDAQDAFFKQRKALDNEQPALPQTTQTPKPKPFSERPMPLEYTENLYKNIHGELAGLGDNRLAKLQKHRGNKNRAAMDNFARTYTKYSNIGYFSDELENTANSRWWDDQTLESEF